MKPDQDYLDAVTRCMMVFQHIEELLKQILTRYEALVYFRLKGYTYYNLKSKLHSIKDAPMGNLIRMLGTYLDDNSLIEQLKAIKKKRDQVAHRSLLIEVGEADDSHVFPMQTSELEDLYTSAEALFKSLVQRWRDFDENLNTIVAKQQEEDELD